MWLPLLWWFCGENKYSVHSRWLSQYSNSNVTRNVLWGTGAVFVRSAVMLWNSRRQSQPFLLLHNFCFSEHHFSQEKNHPNRCYRSKHQKLIHFSLALLCASFERRHIVCVAGANYMTNTLFFCLTLYLVQITPYSISIGNTDTIFAFQMMLLHTNIKPVAHAPNERVQLTTYDFRLSFAWQWSVYLIRIPEQRFTHTQQIYMFFVVKLPNQSMSCVYMHKAKKPVIFFFIVFLLLSVALILK